MVLLFAGPALAHHDDIPNPAPSTTSRKLDPVSNIKRDAVTVSGLSSGAFFAHQFHIAHSKLVVGAGLVAGGPYGCVENIPNPYWSFWGVQRPLDKLSAGLVGCSHILGSRYWGLSVAAPRAVDSVRLIREAWNRRVIDDPENLRAHRVWVFHGLKDELVPGPVTRAVADVYRSLGTSAVATDLDAHEPAANHGMPVVRYPSESPFKPRKCDEMQPPFVIECGYEAAELLLRHLHPDGFKPASDDPHRDGTLLPFDQSEFFNPDDEGLSLSKVGYVYVPTRCGTEPCRLHVAFHGCLQNVELVHDDFIRDAGYNRWAASNGLVVLYPQTTRIGQNPGRCWDFWGYGEANYADQRAKQIRAVKAMVDRVLGAGR